MISCLSPNLSQTVHHLFAVVVICGKLFVLPSLPTKFVKVNQVFTKQFPIPFVPDTFTHISLAHHGRWDIGVEQLGTGTSTYLIDNSNRFVYLALFVQCLSKVQQNISIPDFRHINTSTFLATFTDSFRHEFTVQIIKHRLRISTQITRFTRNRTIRILCFYPLATERIAVCKVIISTSVTS